jgi:hypothetical protein
MLPDINNDLIQYNDSIAINNTNQLTDSNYILEQITKSNSTNKDITNLSKKDELLLKEQLRKSNELFVKLVNETNLNLSNSSNMNSNKTN